MTDASLEMSKKTFDEKAKKEVKTIKSTIVDFMINKATQFKLKLDF